MTPTEATDFIRACVEKTLTLHMAQRYHPKIRLAALKMKLALNAPEPKSPQGRPCLLMPDAAIGEETWAYFNSEDEARAEAERRARRERSVSGPRRYVLGVASEMLVATTETKWAHLIGSTVDAQTPAKPTKPSKKKARK